MRGGMNKRKQFIHDLFKSTKKFMYSTLLCLAFVIAPTGYTLPPIIYVDANTSAISVWPNPYHTIQEGIDAADCEPAVILVAKGTYPEHIALASDLCIIGSLDGTENFSTDDYTIDDLFAYSDIFSRPTIIEDNTSVLGADECTLAGLKITGNGMANDNSSPTLINCIFDSNVEGNNGGAVRNSNGAAPVFYNCVFTNNAATRGGAMYNNASSPTLLNCTIVANETTDTSSAAIHNDAGSSPIVGLSIVWNNDPSSILSDDTSSHVVDYSCIEGWDWGVGIGNINDDPLLDLNMRPGVERCGEELTVSPCVDTGLGCSEGLPEYDLCQVLRPQASAFDMGAFEAKDSDGDGLLDGIESNLDGCDEPDEPSWCDWQNGNTDGDYLPDATEGEENWDTPIPDGVEDTDGDGILDIDEGYGNENEDEDDVSDVFDDTNTINVSFPDAFRDFMAYTQGHPDKEGEDWQNQTPEGVFVSGFCMKDKNIDIPELFYIAMLDWVLKNENAPYHNEVLSAYSNNLRVFFSFMYETEILNQSINFQRPCLSVLRILALSCLYCADSFGVFMDQVIEQIEYDYPDLNYSDYDIMGNLQTVLDIKLYFPGSLRNDMYHLADAINEVNFKIDNIDNNGPAANGDMNGIPDVAELFLLQSCFCADKSPCFYEAVSNWCGNIALICQWNNMQTMLDKHKYNEIVTAAQATRILGAFFTIGDTSSFRLAQGILDRAINVGLFKYSEAFTSLSSVLGPDGDADQDLWSNRQEWEQSSCESIYRTHSIYRFWEYCGNALNPTWPGESGTYAELTCNVQGGGFFNVNGGEPLTEFTSSYYCNTDVILTAIPAKNWEFFHWFVDGEENNTAPITVKMDGNQNAMAVFSHNASSATIADKRLWELICEQTCVFEDCIPPDTCFEGESGCEPPYDCCEGESGCDTPYDFMGRITGEFVLTDSEELQLQSLDGIEYCINMEALDMSALSQCVDLTPVLWLTDPDVNLSNLKRLYLPYCNNAGYTICEQIKELESRGICVFSDLVCTQEPFGKPAPTGTPVKRIYPKLYTNIHWWVDYETPLFDHEVFEKTLAQWDAVSLEPTLAACMGIDLEGIRSPNNDIDKPTDILVYVPVGNDPKLFPMEEEWYQHTCERGTYNDEDWAAFRNMTFTNPLMPMIGNVCPVFNPDTPAYYLDNLAQVLSRNYCEPNPVYSGFNGFQFDYLADQPNTGTIDVDAEEYLQCTNVFLNYFSAMHFSVSDKMKVFGGLPFLEPESNTPAQNHPYYNALSGYENINQLGNKFSSNYGDDYKYHYNHEYSWNYTPVSRWQSCCYTYFECMNVFRNLGKDFQYIFGVDLDFNRTVGVNYSIGTYFDPFEKLDAVTELNQWDLQRMRLGLGTTLLDDGYFMFSKGDFRQGQLWWFDEYDTNLGNNLGEYNTDVIYGIDTYYRDFDRGIAIVNPHETNWSHPIDCECEQSHAPKPDPWNTAVISVLPGIYKDATTQRTGMCFEIPGDDARIYEKGEFEGEYIEDNYVPYTFADVADNLEQNSVSEDSLLNNFNDSRLNYLIALLTADEADVNGDVVVMNLQATTLEEFIQFSENGIPDIAGEFGVIDLILNNAPIPPVALSYGDVVNAFRNNAKCFAAKELVDLDGIYVYEILGALSPELRDIMLAYLTIGDGTYTIEDGVLDGNGSKAVAYAIAFYIQYLGDEYPSLNEYGQRHHVVTTESEYITLPELQAAGDLDGDGCTNGEEWSSSMNDIEEYLSAVVTDDIVPAAGMSQGGGPLRLDVLDSDADLDMLGNTQEGTSTSDGAYSEDPSYHAIDSIPPTVVIGPPSVSQTLVGPVTFLVTYGETETVTLCADDVELLSSGAVDAKVSVEILSSTTRQITLTELSGTGTMCVALKPGTAMDAAGNFANEAGPSEPVIILTGVPLFWIPLLLFLMVIGCLTLKRVKKQIPES